MLYLLPFALALVAERVVAHGGVIGYSNGGKYYSGYRHWDSGDTQQRTIARSYDGLDPITDVNSPRLSCKNDGKSFVNQQTATVEAGSKFSFHWGNWNHPTGSVMTYLGKCPGDTCNGVDSSTLKWFKIDEAGLLSGNINDGLWAAGAMRNNNHTWTSTIPSQVPNGNYIIRHETIALHSLPNTIEMYPGCAQIKIVNGGSRAPTAEELVSFPGAYHRTDPAFGVSLYNGLKPTTYVIPGPPVYGGSRSGSAPKPTAPAAAPAAPVKAPAAPGSAVPEWGQCGGGKGYTGSTICAAPFVCHRFDEYYSQCRKAGSVPAAAKPAANVADALKWGTQCGGINYKGKTVCATNLTCKVLNKYYHQCL